MNDMTDYLHSPTSGCHLTLYLPGILAPPADDATTDTSYRALETLLARAERTGASAPSASALEEELFALFGLQRNEETDAPVAAVTRMLDMGVLDNDWWLRADPVHLRLERDRLLLVDAAMLDITPGETERLVSEIMEVFSADGWLLKAPHPERWYLKPARVPRMTTTPLSQVIGKDVRAFLPQGTDARRWHTTLNEVQILLHASPVNAEREGQGKLPINSLWFWGGGRLPRLAAVPWTQVWSREPISQSLARLSGLTVSDLPSGFEIWRRVAEAGEHLVVLPEAQEALWHDAGRWGDVMRRLEHEWAAPLQKALKAGALARATLVAGSGARFSLDARCLRRWWRRRQSLRQYRRAPPG
jgi:hypothetical protein